MQHDKRYSSQDVTQSLTTLPLPYLWCTYQPPSPVCTSELQPQLHVGLYAEDFLFYSSDTAQEELFKTLLQYHVQVNFMGNVDYLLGTSFTWIQHADGNISVHLCQSEFTGFTARQFSV